MVSILYHVRSSSSSSERASRTYGSLYLVHSTINETQSRIIYADETDMLVPSAW